MLTETLPASWYTDPAIYERERHAIFERTWMAVGYTHQFTDAGDYVADSTAGLGWFVQRGPDGRLRAFHSVCPHRAGPIVGPGEGRIACVDGLQVASLGAWRGIVWVNLDPDAEPLEAWLGTFPSVAESYPLESYRFHRRDVHRLAANWKTYADNYLEGYHIPLVHPGLNRAVDMGRYVVTAHDGGRWNRHDVPTKDHAATTGAWAFLFPNLALNIYPTGMNVERIIPRGPERVDVVFDYFFAEPDGAAAAASMASSTELMAEDRRIVEAVQENMAGGRFERGVLSPRHEGGLAAFQRIVRAALES